jgi:Xaa-Pro aminopeptidase
MKEKRVDRVHGILEQKDLHACLVKGMDNIFYLTGFRGTEGTVLITRGDVILVTDSRYTTYAQEAAEGCTIVETKGKDQSLPDLFRRYGLTRVGFDSCHVNYQVYRSWTSVAPEIDFVPLDGDIEAIRQCKEPAEILAIKKSISIARDAFAAIVPRIGAGRSEKEIAIDLDYTMLRLGGDRPSFDTIVASGPRAALPHGQPTDRLLQAGEPVIIDYGCQASGYCSDETVTLSVGKPDGRIREICDVVREALAVTCRAVRPGLPVQDLDMIARGFIEDKGYGEYFRHGTGHGVGIAIHEAPSITAKVEGLLEQNMVITIEPGIYIPNVGGVRLENMVLVTDKGGEILTHLKKDLIEV